MSDADRPAGMLDPATGVLLGARLALLIAIVALAPRIPVTDDLARFRAIAFAPGQPYRDVSVEYAPLQVLAIVSIAKASAAAVVTRVAILAFVADLGCWAFLRWAWGRRAAVTYLLLGTPLLLFIYQRFDLIVVAAAAAGAALVRRGRQRAGGMCFGAAILTKLWPLVVLPGFWVQRRRVGFWWALGTVALGVAAWISVGGPSGVADVVTFRHATGWGVEGTVGSVLWAAGGSTKLEAGAPRIGHAEPWAGVVLALILAAGLVLLRRRALRVGGDPFGGASAAAVGVLLACSPLLSLQYAAWLLPWGAIAVTDDDRPTVALVGAVSVLTALLYVAYDPARAPLSVALLLTRNALVIALPVVWFLRRPNPDRLLAFGT